MKVIFQRLTISLAWLLPTLMVFVLLVYSGYEKGPPPVSLGGCHADKVIHFFVYGLIATGFFRSFRRPADGLNLRTAALSLMLILLTGLCDEWRQFVNPSRTFEWLDLAADMAGGVTAVLVYTFWTPYRRLLEWSPAQSIRNKSRD